ncbi:hypothetical protein [Methanobrevibacter arboriphilus]|uniref:hypothetical protein n=1 Tax=Methanobrevibacter arboriphilus TaxID=39441 RepID=UPI001CDB27B2|nr:hypothetical protein [Methanobrevibacter arboriphilus]
MRLKTSLKKIYDLAECEKCKVNLAKEYPDDDEDMDKFDEPYIDSNYKEGIDEDDIKYQIID